MLDYTYIENFKFNYLRAREPFSLEELFLLLSTPLALDNPAMGNGPVILDFRQVRSEHIKMHDIRRHLIKKGNLCTGRTGFACAYVMGSARAASHLRVASIFSDLTDVTPEEKSFVTEDFTEAVTWIANILQVDKFAVYQEMEAMALLAEGPSPYGSV